MNDRQNTGVVEVHQESGALHQSLLELAWAGRALTGENYKTKLGITATAEQIQAAIREMINIGVLDEHRRPTELAAGIKPFLRQPALHWRLAVCLLTALKIGTSATRDKMARLAAMLSTRKPPLIYPRAMLEQILEVRRAFQSDDDGASDLNILDRIILAMQRIQRDYGWDGPGGLAGYARANFLSLQAYEQFCQIWGVLPRRLDQHPEKLPMNAAEPENALALCLLAGYWDRLVRQDPFKDEIWIGRDNFRAQAPWDSYCASSLCLEHLAIGVGLVTLPAGTRFFVGMHPVKPEWLKAAVEKYGRSVLTAMPPIGMDVEYHHLDNVAKSGQVYCHHVYYWDRGKDVLSRYAYSPAEPGPETAQVLADALIAGDFHFTLSPTLNHLVKMSFRSNGKLLSPSPENLAHWLKDILLQVTSLEQVRDRAQIETCDRDGMAALTGIPDIALQAWLAAKEFPDQVRIGFHDVSVSYADNGSINLELNRDQAADVLATLTEEVLDRLPQVWADRVIYVNIAGRLSARLSKDQPGELDKLRRQWAHQTVQHGLSSLGSLVDVKDWDAYIQRLTRTVVVQHPGYRPDERLYVVAGHIGHLNDVQSARLALAAAIETAIRNTLAQAADRLPFAFAREEQEAHLRDSAQAGAKLVVYGADDGLPTADSLQAALKSANEQYVEQLHKHRRKRDELLRELQMIRLHARECQAAETVGEVITKVLRDLGFQDDKRAARELLPLSVIDDVNRNLRFYTLPLPPIDEENRKSLKLRVRETELRIRVRDTIGGKKTDAVNAIEQVRIKREKGQLDAALVALVEAARRVKIAEADGRRATF